MKLRSIIATAALFAASAAACIAQNEGVAPRADQLFFPVGLAVDPAGDFLYVANANFDLRYNGGTVVAVDLGAVEELVRGGSNGPVDAADVIDAEATVRIGTFAADLAITPDGSKLAVPVRGDNSVTFVDIHDDGGRRLTCWDGGTPSGSLPACSGDHVIDAAPSSSGLGLPSEPFDVAFSGPYALVTHAGAGEVSLIADVPGTPELVDIQSNLPASAAGIAVHPGTDRVYVTHRGANLISVLDVFDGSSIDDLDADNRPGIVLRKGVDVDVVTNGLDERAVAFHPEGRQAYVTSRTPSSLLVLDTTIGEDGAAVDEWRDAVALTNGPSRVAVHVVPESGRVLVYAVCFDDAVVYAIDPDLGVVDGVLWTGQGPHAVAFDDSRRWVLVADFVTSVIEVFDDDPSSDTYRQSIFTIGVPSFPGGIE